MTLKTPCYYTLAGGRHYSRLSEGSAEGIPLTLPVRADEVID
jgi:hypothetical protein